MIETFSVKVAIASTSTKTPRAVAVPGDSKPERRTTAAGISAAWPPAGCVPPTRATLGPDRSGNVTADQLICHPRQDCSVPADQGEPTPGVLKIHNRLAGSTHHQKEGSHWPYSDPLARAPTVSHPSVVRGGMGPGRRRLGKAEPSPLKGEPRCR